MKNSYFPDNFDYFDEPPKSAALIECSKFCITMIEGT